MQHPTLKLVRTVTVSLVLCLLPICHDNNNKVHLYLTSAIFQSIILDATVAATSAVMQGRMCRRA